MTHTTPRRLPELLRVLQGQGRYSIALEELQQLWPGSDEALRSALRRQREAGRLVSPRRGYYVIVPPEYTATGSPPAAWFLDDLMRSLELPYYLGLLSAAALHGAAHQQPQVSQIVTSTVLAPMTAGRVRLEFHRKRRIAETATLRVNTPTGTMVVSTPASTVFDLVRHVEACGHLDNVATVLAELADQLDAEPLLAAAAHAHLTEVQRVGYLFELVGEEACAAVLDRYLRDHVPPSTALQVGAPVDGVDHSDRWRLWINATVEPDLPPLSG